MLKTVILDSLNRCRVAIEIRHNLALHSDHGHSGVLPGGRLGGVLGGLELASVLRPPLELSPHLPGTSDTRADASKAEAHAPSEVRDGEGEQTTSPVETVRIFETVTRTETVVVVETERATVSLPCDDGTGGAAESVGMGRDHDEL